MDLLWLLIIILFIAWLVGGFVIPIGGSLIHILLVILVIVVIVRLIQGRKVL
jgi:hypothetical protein